MVLDAGDDQSPAREFRLDPSRLEGLASAKAIAYRDAEPFPYVIMDNFLPAEVVSHLIADFPSPKVGAWRRYQSGREVKLAIEDETCLPDIHRAVLREFNGQTFLNFLSRLTGQTGLISDPYLRGSGLHQISRGGLLKVHADFEKHSHLQLHRRLNAILYLNEDWNPAWGGSLELWDSAMTRAVAMIEPQANRLVIFSTTAKSFHGHPDPLACPVNITRKSMAMYFYTIDTSPNGHRPAPVFAARPGETIATPGERLLTVARPYVPRALKKAFKTSAHVTRQVGHNLRRK